MPIRRRQPKEGCLTSNNRFHQICRRLLTCFLVVLSLASTPAQAFVRPRIRQPIPSRPPLHAVGKTGGTVIATTEEYERAVLQSERPVMVFYTAPWCGPCRLSIPVVKEIAKDFADDLDIVEVCTDDLPSVASDAGVVSIPTIQMYYKGEVLDTIVGCVAKSVLSTAVEKVLEEV